MTTLPESRLYQSRSAVKSPFRSAAATSSQLALAAWAGLGVSAPVRARCAIVQTTIFCESTLRHTRSARPSRSKSAAATGCQFVGSVGAFPSGKGAAFGSLPFGPLRSWTATSPVAEFHSSRSSRTSPSKSSIAARRHSGPGSAGSGSSSTRVVPLRRQTRCAPPASSRSTRSVEPSASKSPLGAISTQGANSEVLPSAVVAVAVTPSPRRVATGKVMSTLAKPLALVVSVAAPRRRRLCAWAPLAGQPSEAKNSSV